MSHRSNQQLLEDLGNVDFASLLNNQVVKYDSGSGEWVNGTGGGGSAGELSALTDVSLSSPQPGQSLTYASAGVWNNRYTGLIDVRDFGAVAADSAASAATLNTTAIQNAINYAYLFGAKGVYFHSTYYVNGKIDLQGNMSYVGRASDGSADGYRGGLYDTRSSGVTLSASVADGSQISWIYMENMYFAGAAGGTNTRTTLYLKNASKMRFQGVEVWSAQKAIHGINLWDSDFQFCRFDQCGNTSQASVGVMVLEGSASAPYDCDSTRWYNCTWESNHSAEIQMIGDKANNKLYFIGCKFENASKINTEIALDMTLANHVQFAHCHFSYGKFNNTTGFSTPITVIKGVNNESLQITNCDFEGQVTTAGTYIDQFIWLAGGITHAIVRDNSFAISGGHTIGNACIRYSGTNNSVTDKGNDFRYIASGSPLLRMGRPTTYANELQYREIRTVSSSGSVNFDDQLLLVNANSASIALTLPSASAAPYELTIKKTDTTSNQISVTPASGASIDGSAAAYLKIPNSTLVIVNDGTNWYIVEKSEKVWLSYTPTLSSATASAQPAVGASGLITGRYTIDGSTVEGWAYVRWNGTGASAGEGTYSISLPVTPRTTNVQGWLGATPSSQSHMSSIKAAAMTIVDGNGLGAGTHFLCAGHITSSGVLVGVLNPADTAIDSAYLAPGNPIAFGNNGDAIMIDFKYEAA